jgi:hypothetical protein
MEKLTCIDQTIVADLIEFLHPFEIHSKKLQGHLYPTMPYVALSYDVLLAHCYPQERDSKLKAALRRDAYALLLEKVTITEEHKIATFLWPRFKELRMFPFQAEKQEVVALSSKLK